MIIQLRLIRYTYMQIHSSRGRFKQIVGCERVREIPASRFSALKRSHKVILHITIANELDRVAFVYPFPDFVRTIAKRCVAGRVKLGLQCTTFDEHTDHLVFAFLQHERKSRGTIAAEP